MTCNILQFSTSFCITTSILCKRQLSCSWLWCMEVTIWPNLLLNSLWLPLNCFGRFWELCYVAFHQIYASSSIELVSSRRFLLLVCRIWEYKNYNPLLSSSTTYPRKFAAVLMLLLYFLDIAMQPYVKILKCFFFPRCLSIFQVNCGTSWRWYLTSRFFIQILKDVIIILKLSVGYSLLKFSY